MNWYIAALSVVALASVAEIYRVSQQTEDSSVEPRDIVAPPSGVQRIASERRVRTEHVAHDAALTAHAVTRYVAADFDPVPWTISAWTDEIENAEVFAITVHPSLSRGAVDVRVRRHHNPDVRNKEVVEDKGTRVNRDERFHNRFVHYYYDKRSRGVFLIDVTFRGEHLSFFHRPTPIVVESVPVMLTLTPASEPAPSPPPPPPPPPNPFAERLTKVIDLQTQYEETRSATVARKLPSKIEQIALDDLEGQLQEAVEQLERGSDRAK